MFVPLIIYSNFNLGNNKESKTIHKSKKKEKYRRYKSNVFVKVVRAKLTGTWEGGGIGGKKLTESNLSSTKIHHRCNIYATEIQLRCNLNSGCMRVR